MAPSITPPRRRPYHWLALIPPLGMLVGVPFANRVHTLLLGLPFLLAWIVAWVVLAAACMALVYKLDHRAPVAEGSVE
ncbi:MAG TPA: DUF3311 domain-containing protein [Gemmatimonadaceae bacterium]|jgi:hypothetical protein